MIDAPYCADKSETVPVDLLRDEYLRLEDEGLLTATELAKRLGWTKKTRWARVGDATRLRRALGLKGQRCSKTQRHHVRSRIAYDTAVAIARELGMDPRDAGV